MNISGEVVRTSQLPKKTLGLNDSLVALMSSPLETVTVPVSDFVSFVATQLILAGQDSLDSVTTVGNTTANTITIGGATSPYYQLNTLSPGTQAVGRFVWNDVDGTADLRLKGGNVTLQIGQETVVRVVNKTNANLLESEYKVVRVRVASEGGAQGQRLAVVLAQGNNDPDSVTTLGVVTENINNNQEGFITVFGNVNNINTTGSLQGETWADGDVLFLSPTTPGALTKVKPVAPNHTVVIGYVVYAHANNGKIFVKVDNGYELEELHDVLPTPYVNNGVLYRDTTANLWRSSTISTLLGYTPSNASGTTNYLSKFTGTTTLGNSLIYDNGTNVGIGTTSPTDRLHIVDATDANIFGRVTANGTNASAAWVAQNDQVDNVVYRVFGSAVTGSQMGISLARSASLLANLGGTGSFLVGTFSNTDFILGTANTERARITTSGNFLIGTTVDSGNKLTVSGAISVGTGGGTINNPSGGDFNIVAGGLYGNLNFYARGPVPLRIFGNNDYTYAPFNFNSVSSTNSFLGYYADWTGSNYRSRSTTAGVLGFNNGVWSLTSDTGLTNMNTFTPTVRVTVLANGNVGIGTISPSSRLTVLNTANTVAALIGGGTSTPGWIGIGTVNSGALPIIQGYNNAVNVSNTICLNPSGGNVLIGVTTDAGYKLDVNGTARVQNKLSVGTPTESSAVMEITSTTQGFLTPRMTATQKDAISTPAESLKVYNTTNSYEEIYDPYFGWMPLAKHSAWERTNGFDYFNDGMLADSFMTIGASGAGTGFNTGANILGLNKHGNGTLITGSTSTGIIRFASSTVTIGGGRIRNVYGIQPIVLSTPTERYVTITGFHNVFGTNQTNGIFFLYDEGGVSTGSTATPNFQCVTIDNSSRTFTTTSIVVQTNTYYHLRIDINDAGTQVLFYINETLVATHTTNIPTGVLKSMLIGIMTCKSVGTTSIQSFAVDYIGLRQKFTTPR
jgi:hypothetical protein